jgi:hypothetical protein
MSEEDRQPIISASEVGEYVFCAKAWRLKRDGAIPQSPHLDSGTAFHQEHGRQVSRSDSLRKTAVICALIALLLFVCLALIWLGMRI